MIQAEFNRRLRRAILDILRDVEKNQTALLDAITLTGVLERLHYDVSVNEIRSLLQDMQERGLIEFQKFKDKETGKIRLQKIKMLPRGRDVLDGIEKEPAVDMD
jgi:DNA-binding PadR family transcriptional regulator